MEKREDAPTECSTAEDVASSEEQLGKEGECHPCGRTGGDVCEGGCW